MTTACKDQQDVGERKPRMQQLRPTITGSGTLHLSLRELDALQWLGWNGRGRGARVARRNNHAGLRTPATTSAIASINQN